MCGRRAEGAEASCWIRILLPREKKCTARNKGSRTRLFGSIPDAHLIDFVTWDRIEVVYTSVT